MALAFGRNVVIHEELAAAIEQAIGRKPSPAYLKMAEVPRGQSLIASDPGHFPTVQVENVYVLPGIPEIFQAKIALPARAVRVPALPSTANFDRATSEGRIAEFLNATLPPTRISCSAPIRSWLIRSIR